MGIERIVANRKRGKKRKTIKFMTNRQLQPPEIERIIELDKEGLNYQEIADKTGYSRGTIWKALKESGSIERREITDHEGSRSGVQREIYDVGKPLKLLWVVSGKSVETIEKIPESAATTA